MALPGGGRGDTTGCNESATVAAIANPGDGMSPSLTKVPCGRRLDLTEVPPSWKCF